MITLLSLLLYTPSCSAAALEVRALNASVTLPLPTTVPQNASLPVNPTYPGFAFEERSFYLYAGNTSHPNVFSQNLIKEIYQRTGASPVIRVGGTSLDHSTYNPNQKETVVYPPGQGNKDIPTNMTFGPSFWESFKTYPFAQYILDIPFARLNLTNSLKFAKAGYQTIGSDKIIGMEIGNEPNFYSNANDRGPGYGPAAYAKEWANWTGLIDAALGIENDTKFYEAATIASMANLGEWAIPTVFADGLQKWTNRIKSVSMHFYQTVAGPESDLQRDLMNHSVITTKMSSHFGIAVTNLSKYDPPIPLNLAEVGSALNPQGDNFTLESNLGAALWQVDMLLYGMSIGVNRVNYQSGIGFGYVMWQPIFYRNVSAHVAPPYYAHVFAADFIGNPASKNDSIRVANIDLKNDTLSAYAAYDPSSKELTKVAILNLGLWNASTGTDAHPRPAVNFDMKLPSAKQARVKRLTSPVGAYATGENNGITFGGEKWTYASNGTGKIVLNDTETIDVKANGQVTIGVRSSEAVIVEVLR